MDKKRNAFLAVIFSLVYFTSYLSRNNYAAAMAEIIINLGITKVQAGVAVTGAFVSYGLGQIICGRLGDKVQPHHLITFGLLLTAVCNLTMSFLSDISVMTAVWTVNGFAQSMMWPPLVRIMSDMLPQEKYGKTVTLVTAAANAASIFIYLTVPLWISISGWRLAFRLPAGFVVLVAAVWTVVMRRQHFATEKKAEEQSGARPSLAKLMVILWPLMAAMALQGILRDGITTWMPVYVKEVYNLGTSSSILTTSIIPVFSVIGVYVGKAVYQKLGNEMVAGRLLFAASTVACLALYLVFGKVVAITVLLMAVVVGLMNSSNLILTSFPPTLFRREGMVSTVSGLLNASVYVGSALSAYGFAAISEEIGWHSTVLMWVAIAGVACVVCAGSIRGWTSFMESRK